MDMIVSEKLSEVEVLFLAPCYCDKKTMANISLDKRFKDFHK